MNIHTYIYFFTEHHRTTTSDILTKIYRVFQSAISGAPSKAPSLGVFRGYKIGTLVRNGLTRTCI